MGVFSITLRLDRKLNNVYTCYIFTQRMLWPFNFFNKTQIRKFDVTPLRLSLYKACCVKVNRLKYSFS